MVIHNKFVGGNVFVDRTEGDHVYLRNERRDSVKNWFYWAFCVEGAEGREITFHSVTHEKSQWARLGFFGPAVSHDLVHWEWLDSVSDDYTSFTYRFGENESRVYFAHHMLYHPQQFLDFADRAGLAVSEFCKSRKGNPVPAVTFGEGEKTIVLTARHHACESVGGYVLEGILEELKENPIENTRILCVPFMDYDGVVDGDHGKHRYPHDYNRDYTDAPIYPEVKALTEYVARYGCHYGFDFHSPSHRGKEHDHIYFMRTYKHDRLDRFSDLLLSECVDGGMHHSPAWHRTPQAIPEVRGTTFNSYMNFEPSCILATTVECTYAGLPENKVTTERLRVFGRSFARALRRFDAEFKPKS